MIYCPLCNKQVLDETNKFPIANNDLCDFYCPTKIIFTGYDRGPLIGSHYYRQTFQGCYPEYGIIVPPFKMVWLDGRKNLKIYDYMKGFRNFDEPNKYFDKIELPEVIRKAKQLHALRAFL